MIVRNIEKPKPYPDVKCSERLIQQAYLRSRQHERIVIIPNVSWGFFDHEMDLCEVSKSGYITEIEIKISKADLKADKKKDVFHTDKHNRIKYLYYAVPYYLADAALELIPDHAGLISFVPFDEKRWQVEKYRKSPMVYKGHRKLTPEEHIKLFRLGCLRMQRNY